MKLVKPIIHQSAYIAPNASIFGDVTIAKDSNIWFHVTVRGDSGAIHIGEGTNVQDNSVLHSGQGYTVEIGNNVTIGHGAIVHGCIVGDNTLIGMGAIILNGAVIGKNCIIGANALVTQKTVIPDNSLVLGSPGKVVRQVTDEEIESNIKNAVHYVEMGKPYIEYFNGMQPKQSGQTKQSEQTEPTEHHSVLNLKKEKSGRDPEPVIHMNMCMIKHGDKVLALDKVGSSYSGTTFPGGHMEPGETMHDAVIREVYEETGLTIKNPVLKGLYHWYQNDVHNMGYLYLATEFEGDIKSSEEGRVYWIPLEEYKKKELANGMTSVLRVIEDDSLSECFMKINEDGSESEWVL